LLERRLTVQAAQIGSWLVLTTNAGSDFSEEFEQPPALQLGSKAMLELQPPLASVLQPRRLGVTALSQDGLGLRSLEARRQTSTRGRSDRQLAGWLVFDWVGFRSM
jgi:hypothetical protein